MRFAVVAVVLCMLMVGLGYAYHQESSAPTFLTAPVERGKYRYFGEGQRHCRSSGYRRRQFATFWANRGGVRQFQRPCENRTADCATGSRDLCRAGE
jgi:hypothetical protein